MSYKCTADQLKVLAARIAARIAKGSSAKPASAITGHYEASPWFYTMEIINEDATDANAALGIETGTLISFCDIVGQDFWQSLDDQQRVAVGPCLLQMIEQSLIEPSFSDDSGKASATVGSKKVAAKK